MSDVDCDSLFETKPPPPAVAVRCLAQREGDIAPSVRSVPEETAIAFTFNGLTHAVMMASPSDLEDFAIGFALTEGLIDRPADIASLEIIATRLGVELRAWLPSERAKAYSARRRSMAGPTGCGLCGIESLEEAMRSAPPVSSAYAFGRADIVAAMQSLPGGQELNLQTHAVHAAQQGTFRPLKREAEDRLGAPSIARVALWRRHLPQPTANPSLRRLEPVSGAGAPKIPEI